ncbi:hypothetical protein ESB00_08995 [Oleiharenicola lentus]|jgi:hypothetical protein|uniref:Uncharacterized protein n=1 Tax=Oleiharenicola lentus TaxID=2508720 RepID=A0A4Q1CAS0_9BACT|nr:hypothetical protein [Oleiharenicola lentus]RXK55996.1 hypothetical protein ESB00_08995 [Oleiharenicola lentus]
MAENKKIEKALYGPSATEVALGALLGLLVGVFAACVYLVLKPVSTVKEMPKEPIRGMLYYIAGSDSTAKGRTWSAKQKQFIAGTSVTLVEEELNAWATGTFTAAPKPAAAGAKAEEAKATDNGIFQPGTPNFKFVNGKLQIGTKCVLNWYGLTTEVMVISTGVFERSGDRFVFKAETLHLGSCPLHLLPSLSGPLFDHLVGKKKTPDDIKSAWVKLGDVVIEGTTLKLSFQ